MTQPNRPGRDIVISPHSPPVASLALACLSGPSPGTTSGIKTTLLSTGLQAAGRCVGREDTCRPAEGGMAGPAAQGVASLVRWLPGSAQLVTCPESCRRPEPEATMLQRDHACMHACMQPSAGPPA